MGGRGGKFLAGEGLAFCFGDYLKTKYLIPVRVHSFHGIGLLNLNDGRTQVILGQMNLDETKDPLQIRNIVSYQLIKHKFLIKIL